MQTGATLLVVTCCVRLHNLMHVVVDCWEHMHCLHFLLGPPKYPGEIKKRLCKILRGKQGILSYVQTEATTPNNVASVCTGLKSLTGLKLCPTTHNNMQQGEKTGATCYIQQCWELLANNFKSVCT